MLKVKVTAVGNSMGILLLKEAHGKLNAERGNTLYLVEGPEGYTLTAYDHEFEEQVTATRGIMKHYKNALKELAKKEPKWLKHNVVSHMHNLLLAEHGGPGGTRDGSLLKSALDRPKNKFGYEAECTLHYMTSQQHAHSQ